MADRQDRLGAIRRAALGIAAKAGIGGGEKTPVVGGVARVERRAKAARRCKDGRLNPFNLGAIDKRLTRYILPSRSNRILET
mgnify:CR=1 FL=1